MRNRHPALIALVLAMVVLVTALAVVSCGGGDVTTTSAVAPTTTGAPDTTAVPTTTGAPATTAVAPTTTAMTAATADGAALYATNCAGCHSGVPGGTAERVAAVVKSGVEEMPAFEGMLTAEEIAAIVGYVTSGGN